MQKSEQAAAHWARNVRGVHFTALDAVRRAQGDMLGVFGFGPQECAYRVVASGAHWRLRDYGGEDALASLLIVAAPIKRPYIWDIAPDVSAIRYCRDQGLHPYLVEWVPPTQSGANAGLAEYADAIGECVATISRESGEVLPFAIGHSLGGTLAAIFAALQPRVLSGLVLLGAPLCFQPATCEFRDALVAILPPDLAESEVVPGSLLSQASAMASPRTFVWERMMDAARTMNDREATDIRTRVERWALDEVPLPGKLVRQIVEWLYRDNRLCNGTLSIGEATIAPSQFALPTLAIVNSADEVAPLASVKPFLDAMATTDVRVIEHPGETGVVLQHLAVLVGREAHAQVWPQIVAWLREHR